MEMVLGYHYILDMRGCNLTILQNTSTVESTLQNCILQAKIPIVAQVHHQFSPHGFSCVFIVAESHVAIHTWPEYAFASVDFFSCNLTIDGEAFMQTIAHAFGATEITIRKIERG